MAQEMICLDTSILIDFFRKKKKENSVFYQLTHEYQLFAVSVITEYEIHIGSTQEQQAFWETFFKQVATLPFDSEVGKVAVEISKSLKSKNKI